MLEKLFTSKIMLIASFLLLAAGLVAGVTVIRYPQILFPEAAQCPGTGPFKLYCTWGAPVGAVSYDYAVTKETANGNIELVKTETGITNTHANFDGYPDDKYTCSVYAYNDCGSKSQLAVGTPFSCTAAGCENCVGGTEKKYPADVWDKNGNGQIDDCAEACLAFFGPDCTNGTCASPGSTNPANCCGCQTTDGASCATLPTPTPPPGCNCTDADWDCQTDCADDSYETSDYYCYNCDPPYPNFQYYCCPIGGGPAPTATPIPDTCLDPGTYCTPGEHTCCDNGGDYECLPYDNPAGSHTCQLVPAETGTISGTVTVTNNSGSNIDSVKVYRCGKKDTDASCLATTPTTNPANDASWLISKSGNIETYGYRIVTDSEGKPIENGAIYKLMDAMAWRGSSWFDSNEINILVTAPDDNVNFTITIPAEEPPAQTGTISAKVTIDNSSNRDIERVGLNIMKVYTGPICFTHINDIRPSDINSGTFTYTLDQPVDDCELIIGETWKLCALLKTSDNAYFSDPKDCGAIDSDVRVTVGGDTANFHFTLPAAGTGLQGDISGAEGEPDGSVDAADASVLMSNWGVPFGFNPAADLNGDGKVDALDASLLIQGWSAK